MYSLQLSQCTRVESYKVSGAPGLVLTTHSWNKGVGRGSWFLKEWGTGEPVGSA